MSAGPLLVIPLVVGLTLKEEAAFLWTEGFKLFRDAVPVVEIPPSAQLNLRFSGNKLQNLSGYL